MATNRRVILEYLFRRLHEWRENIHTGYRWVACDEHSNFILRLMRDEDGYVVYSDNPAKDGYYVAVADTPEDNVTAEHIMFRDVDLGLDFSDDPEFADVWNGKHIRKAQKGDRNG